MTPQKIERTLADLQESKAVTFQLNVFCEAFGGDTPENQNTLDQKVAYFKSKYGLDVKMERSKNAIRFGRPPSVN